MEYPAVVYLKILIYILAYSWEIWGIIYTYHLHNRISLLDLLQVHLIVSTTLKTTKYFLWGHEEEEKSDDNWNGGGREEVGKSGGWDYMGT